eukprot:10703859-Alexandrium_andersonii.AAC.1
MHQQASDRNLQGGGAGCAGKQVAVWLCSAEPGDQKTVRFKIWSPGQPRLSTNGWCGVVWCGV